MTLDIVNSTDMDNTTDHAISTSNLPGTEEHYWELTMARVLYVGPSLIFLILGTIGNSLSFLVFNRKSMKQSVTSLYFRMLAISDTGLLFSCSWVFFIIGAFDYDVRLVSNASCKIFITWMVVACYHACWILVFIAFDRFIGVYLPHKYRQYCSQKRALIVMITSFILITITVGVFMGTALELSADKKSCGISPTYLPFFVTVYQYLDLCLLNLIPTILLVSLNIGIIIKISKASVKRQSTPGSPGKSCKKATNPTAILLSVSLVYILCTIPTSTKFLVKLAMGNSQHAVAQFVLYSRACDILYLADHAVNFFLYCVHGTGFRNELFALLGRKSKSVTSFSSGTQISLISKHKEQYTKHDVD